MLAFNLIQSRDGVKVDIRKTNAELAEIDAELADLTKRTSALRRKRSPASSLRSKYCDIFYIIPEKGSLLALRSRKRRFVQRSPCNPLGLCHAQQG